MWAGSYLRHRTTTWQERKGSEVRNLCPLCGKETSRKTRQLYWRDPQYLRADFSIDNLCEVYDPLPKCVKARKQAIRASALEADTFPEIHQGLCAFPGTISVLT